jgi:hypothetical protein
MRYFSSSVLKGILNHDLLAPFRIACHATVIGTDLCLSAPAHHFRFFSQAKTRRRTNMRGVSAALLLCGLWGTACFLPTAHGFEKFVKKIPNGDSVPGITALGHVNHEGGGARNQFGRAFQDAGKMWSEEFCNEDTDGDGQTNGQELGDPCCSWVETGNLAYIRGISDPADPTSMTDPMIFKYIQCTKSEEAVEEAEKLAKKTKTPKPTTPAPTPSFNIYDDIDDGEGSGSLANDRDDDKEDDPGREIESSGARDGLAVATAVTVAMAWALLQ